MQPNQLHQTIAQQIDHMKPDHLRPGVDIGMQPIDETTLAVVLVTRRPKLRFDVRYDEGPDTYTVTRLVAAQGALRTLTPWISDEPISGIYCDQLGEIVFGDEAKDWTQPIVKVSTDDGETWETIA